MTIRTKGLLQSLQTYPYVINVHKDELCELEVSVVPLVIPEVREREIREQLCLQLPSLIGIFLRSNLLNHFLKFRGRAYLLDNPGDGLKSHINDVGVFSIGNLGRIGD